MKLKTVKDECIEPELGLYVLDWQQGWLDTGRTDDMERKQAVEEHLIQCSACMAGVTLMDELKTVLQRHPDLLDEPARYLEPKLPSMIPRWRAAAALAAGLVMGVTLTLSWRHSGGMLAGESGASAMVLRRPAADALASARAAYTGGRYAEVIQQLQPLAGKGSLSAEGAYYLGLGYAGLGQRAAACEQLRLAVANSQGMLLDDARWALVHSLVAAGKIREAREHLDRLVATPRYEKEAKALLDSLVMGTRSATRSTRRAVTS
ncbi:MAG: hypothetical protein HYR55_11165 [Acidobacteria bacterium]|nr:hypothetical protein [Acidobacteriota bacterium]MBI3657738.1 hypothetical protein [Acidobacteriota bacterium]